MPANVTALIMKASPGAELVCIARNYAFAGHAGHVEHGVISYYAFQTLPHSTTMASWLKRIEAMALADLQHGQLKPLYRPSLHIVGNRTMRLPGFQAP